MHSSTTRYAIEQHKWQKTMTSDNLSSFRNPQNIPKNLRHKLTIYTMYPSHVSNVTIIDNQTNHFADTTQILGDMLFHYDILILFLQCSEKVDLLFIAFISRMDTASARYIEHQEVWGYCIQGQWFQECNWILFKGRCISPHVS